VNHKLSLLLGRAYLLEHPGDAASVLEACEPGNAALALADLPAPERLTVMRRMRADAAARTLAAFTGEAATDTVLGEDPARVARWLALLDQEVAEALLNPLPEAAAKQVREALSYPSGTAGSLMDADVIAFTPNTSIEAVTETLRGMKQRITDLMICDEDELLLGVVPLQELLGASPGSTVGSLPRRDLPAVQPMTSRDDVVALMEQHRLASLPVVGFDRRLLGIIRYDGLVRAAQQALTDDLQRMVGAGSEERALSSPWLTMKSRLPWLLINLLTAFAAAAVVGVFDGIIAQFTALAVLLPVVAGQSGNTGAQALAVTSRGLALREIRLSHWWKVVRKEVAAAAANGVAIASVTSAGVWIWSSNLGLCVVIGSSMISSMVLAAIAGAVIPILLTAFGRDPATASAIVLTTVTDITGFFSFLGLATLLSDTLTAG